MSEADTKRKVKQLLDKHGWFKWMPPANVGGQSDHLALKAGIFLAIEAKKSTSKGGTKDAPKGSALQEDFMANVRKAGGFAMVVNLYNLDKFEALLQSIDRLIAHRAQALLIAEAQLRDQPYEPKAPVLDQGM